MKNVLITGASRGIGFELAKIFSASGNNVVAVARNTTGLKIREESPESLKGEIFTLGFDLSNGDYENQLLPFVREKLNNIDIIINNAGLLRVKNFEDFDDEDFDAIFSVNVKSVFKTVKTLLKIMNTNSHIVNIGSMGGFQGSAKFKGLSLYSAAKGAVAVLTESMAEEFKERGIKVNALALGAVQTEMLASAFPGYKAPLTAGQMAEFIADFALNGHKYFNGKILPVSLSTP
jgi:NAD(P)-dependent dehydrogenase (short-subunit alcohol dehydrogenase family)